ncbi:MAG TPA: YvcK family protein [Bacillota bacterium]|jgi:uncharacterized cofD-like protein|nr:YvcK family protein [Bacillota bacterium]HOL08852.1 YvcK family protein [Bacillota bacterium]HPO96545.1 YvcK family protein [Bacillota bacterium]
MTKSLKVQLVVFAWMVWVVVCLFSVISGFFIITNWLKLPLNSDSRVLLGLILVISGTLVGYYGTLRFFWYIIHWWSKSRQKNGKQNRGPKVVVVGGGTGLGTILRGLKEITSNLTAIVTVADDGGSSGRLRREFGILPPGDIRNCLVAMADIEPLMEKLMQYRFQGDSELAGHNFGNLLLAALVGITGDFEEAIKESSKVLAVRGQVLPATLAHINLKARLKDGQIVSGESKIGKVKSSPIEEVYLEPADSKPVPEALEAIEEADVIVLGPGSLYTSVIPNLLVKGITTAIQNSNAVKLYICNAMTQQGETDNYTASDHVKAILKHTNDKFIDIAVINVEPIPEHILERYAEEGAKPVIADLEKIRELGVTPLGIKVIVKSNVIRHDAAKLAALIENITKTKKLEKAFGRYIVRQIYKFFKGVSRI